MPGHRQPKVKESRWERIRKKHMLNTNKALKNDTVKRFIEMDFIGKYNEEMMIGDNEHKTQLNPLIVMELRHENIKTRFRRYLPVVPATDEEETHMSCVSHNIAVEEHYINNELNKLRNQFKKNHERSKKLQQKVEAKLGMDDTLMQSLNKASKCIESYYTTPIDAIEEMEKICEAYAVNGDNSGENKEDRKVSSEMEKELNGSEQDYEGNHLSKDDSVDDVTAKTTLNIDLEAQLEAVFASEFSTDYPKDENDSELLQLQSDFTMIEEISDSHGTPIVSHYESATTTNTQMMVPKEPPCEENINTADEVITEPYCPMQHAGSQPTRYVHFDNEIDVIDYKQDICTSLYSNTSDGIESVISDIAEEALMELDLEDKEMKRAQLQSARKELTVTVEEENPEKVVEDDDAELFIHGMHIEAPLRGRQDKELLPSNALERQSSCCEDTEGESTESTASNQEQNKIIANLFQSHAHTNNELKYKYFLKWTHYTTISKIERENCTRRNDRVQKINMFLDKIRKEKVRLNKKGPVDEQAHHQDEARPNAVGTVQIKKKFQNKIKIQQDIIDMQREKLERQERLIMELKLNKLSDEAKDARQEIKNRLKSVIRCGEAKTKAKAKCLQLMGGADLKDVQDEDEFARLQGRRMMIPKFLEAMQERALERSVRHEQARQRRAQQDAEREAQKAALEEAKRLEDEEAKRQRIEALKEKRRMEKHAKILKERERQTALENHKKAQEFCRQLLLRRVGMEGFKRLLQRKRDIKQRCTELRRNVLQRYYFNIWRQFYERSRDEKEGKADDLYRKILLRTGLSSWRLYVANERSKWLVAVDWYDFKLTESTFVRWFGYVKRQKMIQDAKMNQARSHHEWHLKWKVLDCWQRLSYILQLEKETEERRQRWRMKIWDLLPDYTPNRDEYA